jgi:hypothetical protein
VPTTGPIPRLLSSATQASPTGPSPSTIAASVVPIRLLLTAWTPTARGSVIAASDAGTPSGTGIASSSLSTSSSAYPPG